MLVCGLSEALLTAALLLALLAHLLTQQRENGVPRRACDLSLLLSVHLGGCRSAALGVHRAGFVFGALVAVRATDGQRVLRPGRALALPAQLFEVAAQVLAARVLVVGASGRCPQLLADSDAGPRGFALQARTSLARCRRRSRPLPEHSLRATGRRPVRLAEDLGQAADVRDRFALQHREIRRVDGERLVTASSLEATVALWLLLAGLVKR